MGAVWFYLRIICGVPGLLLQSVQTVEGAFAAIVFLGVILGVPALNRWADTHLNGTKWGFRAVIAYFVFLLLWSNYDAFNQARLTHADDVKQLNLKLDGVLSELKIKSVLNDQLTKENGALAAGGRILTDAQARIEAIRKELLDHASKAPSKETFSTESAHEWWVAANAIKEQTLNHDSTLFLSYIDEKKCTFEQLVESVASLRAVAANLTEKDLANHDRNSQR